MKGNDDVNRYVYKMDYTYWWNQNSLGININILIGLKTDK